MARFRPFTRNPSILTGVAKPERRSQELLVQDMVKSLEPLGGPIEGVPSHPFRLRRKQPLIRIKPPIAHRRELIFALPSWARSVGASMYRIHASNEPWTIGHAVSSGSIRMTNQDVIDLYDRVAVGTRVVVLSTRPQISDVVASTASE